VAGSDGREHVALSNGWQCIRLDVLDGRFSGEKAVFLRFRLDGLASAEFKLLTLRRFLALCRYGRFARSLFPPDPGMARAISVLRAHDALTQGASQREIGGALFGAARVEREWNGSSDSLRSRVRRLIREARRMARGDYRLLLRKCRRSGAEDPHDASC
jgi:hypothetical protein